MNNHKQIINSLNRRLALVIDNADVADYNLYINIADYFDSIKSNPLFKEFLDGLNKELRESIDYIAEVYEIVNNPKDELGKGDLKFKLENVDYVMIFTAIKTLKNGQKVNLASLTKRKYIVHIQRLHNAVLDYLESINGASDDSVDEMLYFQDNILFFKGKEIDFSKKPNQRELLTILFKDSRKVWFYDEIQDEWDHYSDEAKKDKEYWRKFNTAGDEINKAIAIKTQVEDFIKKNTKEIGINPKYIQNS
ncbi:hypothetical protein HOE31_00910 [bacterium]|jgi:hypothetical protein|nr:hypothetical protein [bacterium]MBT4121495.1 hypothetical protein [bacterium]